MKLSISSSASFVLILLLMSVTQVLGQEVILKSVDEAITMALARNKDYDNYLLEQQKAQQEYKQARSHRFPTISGTFSGQRNLDLATTPLPGEIFGEPGQTIDAQFGQAYTYNAGISISKDLFNRQAALNARISGLNRDLKAIEKEVFEELLQEQVILYYYTGLVANRAKAIGEQDLESAINLVQLSTQKYEEGLIDAITLNTAKINENAVRQNLISSEQLALQCEIELKKLLGMQSSDPLVFNETLEYQTPQAYFVQQLRADPILESAGLQLRQAEMNTQLSKSSLLPVLSVNSYYGRQQFRDDFGLSFSGDNWNNYSYLSLGLSVPIFTGFNNKSKIKQSQIGQQMAFNSKQEVENSAILNDQRLIADYEFSRRDAQKALETYELYQENLTLTLAQYEEGIIGLDHYLNVFEEYLKAENAYLNATSKMYTHYSQIIPRVSS